MTLPLRLPGARMTDIINQTVNDRLDSLMERIDNVFPDDTFPGTQDLPPNQRLNQYLTMTTAVSDMALLAMPDYVELYKQGQVPPPQSPQWLTALSDPSEFEHMQKDFTTLARRTQK